MTNEELLAAVRQEIKEADKRADARMLRIAALSHSQSGLLIGSQLSPSRMLHLILTLLIKSDELSSEFEQAIEMNAAHMREQVAISLAHNNAARELAEEISLVD